MIPLKDNVPTGGTPLVTLALILAAVVLYLADWSPGLADLAWPWAALASLLLSASLLALAVNMLFLWLFGESIETGLGVVRFAALFVAAGLVAAGAQELTDPGAVPSVGVAGSIAGLIGAHAVLFPGARILCWVLIPFFVTFVEVPALLLAAGWLALQAIPELGQPPLIGLAGGAVTGLAAGALWARSAAPVARTPRAAS